MVLKPEPWAFHARWDRDRILPGHALLKKLLRSNFVLTPSGMVRRECYAGISLFRLDLPWVGDWYLWCLFALYHDVGYLAEHMLCYREQHASSMTEKLTQESQDKLDACAVEEISVPWLIRSKAREMRNRRIERECLTSVAHTYARTIASERYRQSSRFMNFSSFERSLTEYTASHVERDFVRARVYAEVGNHCYWRRELSSAKKFYRAALRRDPWMGAVITKRLLLSLGRPGDFRKEGVFCQLVGMRVTGLYVH